MLNAFKQLLVFENFNCSVIKIVIMAFRKIVKKGKKRKKKPRLSFINFFKEKKN